jgi:hypothetical protein
MRGNIVGIVVVLPGHRHPLVVVGTFVICDGNRSHKGRQATGTKKSRSFASQG